MRSPYPDRAWGELAGFTFEDPLVLVRTIEAVKARSGEDADYIVGRDFTVSFALESLLWDVTVPAGFVTDLASVPRLARWLVDRVGPHLEASIVHDWLYTVWQDMEGRGARAKDRDFADAVLWAGMRAAGVGWLKAQAVYWAVRAGGWPAYSSPNPVRRADVPAF